MSKSFMIRGNRAGFTDQQRHQFNQLEPEMVIRTSFHPEHKDVGIGPRWIRVASMLETHDITAELEDDWFLRYAGKRLATRRIRGRFDDGSPKDSLLLDWGNNELVSFMVGLVQSQKIPMGYLEVPSGAMSINEYREMNEFPKIGDPFKAVVLREGAQFVPSDPPDPIICLDEVVMFSPQRPVRFEDQENVFRLGDMISEYPEYDQGLMEFLDAVQPTLGNCGASWARHRNWPLYQFFDWVMFERFAVNPDGNTKTANEIRDDLVVYDRARRSARRGVALSAQVRIEDWESGSFDFQLETVAFAAGIYATTAGVDDLLNVGTNDITDLEDVAYPTLRRKSLESNGLRF